MGITRGKNAGVAGNLVSVLLDGKGTKLAFNAKVTSQGGGIVFPKIDRRGRGSAGAPKMRLGDAAGEGSIEGELQLIGYPSPDKPKFNTGTLRYVMQTEGPAAGGGTPVDFVDLPVRFTGFSWSLVEGKQELWSFKASWELDGNPAWTWKGVQVTLSAPGANDQETYEGLAKTYDGNGLATGAVQRIDCEGIADTDAAEATKLAALLAAATVPPLANLKVVSIALSRSDSNGIAVFITWGLQDSKDQIETPQNVFLQDPNALTDSRTIAAVFPNASPPSPPTAPSGLKIVSWSDAKLNDQQMVRSFAYGLQDSKDKIETPQNVFLQDPNALADSRTLAIVFPTGTPPSTPAAPSGLKIITYSDAKLTDVKSARSFAYGLQDSKDKIETPQNVFLQDPNSLTDSRTIAIVFTTGTPPATPAAPSGLKIVTYSDAKLTDVKSARSFIYRRADTKDEKVLPQTWEFLDPSGLASKASAAALNGTPSLPAGYVDRGTRSVSIVPGAVFSVTEGGLRSTADDVTMPATSSFRSALTPYRDAVASIVNSALSDASVADSQWSSFQSIDHAFGVSVTSLDRAHKRVVLEYMDPGIQVMGATRGGGRWVPAKIDAGVPKVYLLEQTLTSGQSSYRHFSRYMASAPIRQFTMVRLLKGTSIPEQVSLIGKTNNATFLGLAAGTCLYTGPEYVTNIGLSGTYPFMMYFHFYTDANGIFDYEGLRDDWFPAAAGKGNGWVAASGLSDYLAVNVPSQGDFSVFLA